MSGLPTWPDGAGRRVLHVFPSFAVGGAQVRFAALANRFGPRWRHVIVAMDGRTECAERLSAEVPFVTMGPPVPRGAGTPATLRAVRAALRALAPETLVTSNWGSIEWAMANLVPPRIRHVHTEDGFGPDEAGGQKPRRILTRRLVLRWSDLALPSTILLRSARDIWKLPERRLHYIPNGLDLRRFRPHGPRAELVVPGEGPLIGTVAALRAEKNLARLIRACAILHAQGIAFRLVIIGDGAERAMLEALTAERGIAGRTLFAGHVPDPAAAYRAMDVFALSSDTEQMPFSVMEAMGTALPVAATAVGDLRAMLPAAQHDHIAPLTDGGLAAALRPLLEDAALRARLGAANRAKAEQDYDEETMFARYAALIEGPG